MAKARRLAPGKRKAKPTLEDAYRRVAEVASPSDSEGLKKQRAILLLWYLRNVLGIDDLEAYEYVCDGDRDQGVDALYFEPASEGQAHDVLHIFQSKYPEKPKNVGEGACTMAAPGW